MKYHINIENGDTIASFEYECDRDSCIDTFRHVYDEFGLDYFSAVDDKEPRIVETILNKDIPNDVRETAIAEARLIAENELADFSDCREIDCFALWEDTPSGHDFWDRIANAEDLK